MCAIIIFMSIKNEILEILITPKYYYKGVPVNAFFLPAFGNYKKRSIRNTFYSLNKDGYVEKVGGHYVISKIGKDFLSKNTKQHLKNFESIENSGPKNLLLLYDIPEDKRSERNWFRRTLVKFGFIMIQRSVWVGPSPLPKEFLEYVKHIKLKDSIKTFKLERGYEMKK